MAINHPTKFSEAQISSLVDNGPASIVAPFVINLSPSSFGLTSPRIFPWLAFDMVCPDADLWFPPRRRADFSVSLLAGTPPCNCRYLAQPLLPRWRAASMGVISWPLLVLMTGFSSAWLSSRIYNTAYIITKNIKCFLVTHYNNVKWSLYLFGCIQYLASFFRSAFSLDFWFVSFVMYYVFIK